ncbi:MAG: hypothetical protein HGA61_00695 [Candidatus Moranbacteria bacterium]|nr:hypothetical protein [Candidatus Moranbacteria bacterium]
MQDFLKDNDFLKTTDLLTCNVLAYFGHIIEAIDRSDHSRCTFVIKREKHTDEILEKLYKGQLLAEPKRFQAIQKEIKSRIYN